MGKLMNNTSMAIDGLMEVTDWFVPEGDHDAAARDLFAGAAGAVFGRPTFEGLRAYWTQQDDVWANLFNPMPKFVASTTLEGPLDWNTTLIEGDAANGLERLKKELDGDLILIGCGELAIYLIEKGVVDELWFWLHPAVGGDGPRPYLGKKVPMRLLDSTRFDSGVVLQCYEPV